MKNGLIILTTILLCLTGCEKAQEEPKHTPKQGEIGNIVTPDDPNDPDDPEIIVSPKDTLRVSHYLLGFVQPYSFTAAPNISLEPVFSINYETRWQDMKDYCLYFHEKDSQEFPRQSAAYTALCKQYNDMTYTQERYVDPIYINGPDTPKIKNNVYLMNNIVSIHVVTNTNYNENHPAGSSLDDICILIAVSPRKYIESGYTETYNWKVIPDLFTSYLSSRYRWGEGAFPIAKPLSECIPDDMILAGDGWGGLCHILLTELPDSETVQEFTVTLTDELGTVFTTTVDNIRWWAL